MARLYEVKIATFTRVLADSEEEAEAFARAAIETIEFQNVELPGELVSFGSDDVDIIDDTDDAEEDQAAA